MSTAPTILFGLVPLIRATVDSATNATTTTVTADDSGTLFLDRSTSTHTYTLPAVALSAGKTYLFMKCADANMVISSAGSLDDIIADGDTAADTVTYGTSSHKTGSACLVFGDGTNHFVINIGGTTATVG